MRRRVAIGLVVVAAAATLWFLLDAQRAETVQASTPVEPTPSTAKWSQPITEHRGAKRLEGRVTFEGAPVAGAIVTAVASHGDDLLSNLECRCHRRKLLECVSGEANDQLAEVVAARVGEAAVLARATTDQQGHFVLDGLDETELALWADSSAGIAYFPGLHVGAADVELALSEGRTIEGVVTGTDDVPLAGALVTAIDVTRGRFFEAATDATGSFHLGPVLLGRYRLVASTSGRQPDVMMIGDNDDPLTFRLPLSRIVAGTVRHDGVPVSGAVVTLEGQERTRTTTTDGLGQFRFEHVRPGSHGLGASASGLIATTSVTVRDTADSLGLDLKLVASFTVTGTVVDDHGAGVSAVHVSADGTLVDDDHGAGIGIGGFAANISMGRGEVTTDSRGRFAIAFTVDLARSEHVRFTAWKAGYHHQALPHMKLTPGMQPLVITLTPAAVVEGRVVDSLGRPVPACEVSAEPVSEAMAQSQRTETSAEGRFSLDLDPTQYTLAVRARGYRRATLETPAPANGLVITLDLGARVNGSVLEADGTPVVGAFIGADNLNDSWARSDRHGRFELTGLTAGTHTLLAVPRFSDIGQSLTRHPTATVTLHEGESATVELRAKPGVTVEGMVVAAGEPVPGARISMLAAATDGDAPDRKAEGFLSAGKDGRFVIKGLPPGQVTLWVAGANAGFEEDRWPTIVTAPASGVIINLDDRPMIEGRLVDDDGAPIQAFEVNGKHFTGTDGGFSLPGEAGEQPMTYRASGHLPLGTRVQIKPGKNNLGEITLTKLQLIGGRVFDAQTGEGLEGASVALAVQPLDPSLSPQVSSDAVVTASDGRFQIRGDPRATLLFIQRRDFVPTRREVAASTQTVDVGLDRGASIEFTLVGGDGRPLIAPGPVVIRGTGPNGQVRSHVSHGISTVRGLEQGTWRFQATGAGFVFQLKTITLLQAGGTTAVTIHASTEGVTATPP